MENKPELKIMSFVNENNPQYKKKQKEKEIREVEEDINKMIDVLNKKALEDARKRYYEQSIQDENNSKKQQIYGGLYYRKEEIIKFLLQAVAISAGILLVGGAIKFAEFDTTLGSYYGPLKHQMKEELMYTELKQYEQDHDNPISDRIDDYNHIISIEEELKTTGNYDKHGNNISDPTKKYPEIDPRIGGYQLNDIRYDAIDIAINETIDEYEQKTRSSR